METRLSALNALNKFFWVSRDGKNVVVARGTRPLQTITVFRRQIRQLSPIIVGVAKR